MRPPLEWYDGDPDATEHRLVRLDILGRSYLRGRRGPIVNPGRWRMAHCSCGARAEIEAGEGHEWIELHRYRPCLAPAELATLFGRGR